MVADASVGPYGSDARDRDDAELSNKTDNRTRHRPTGPDAYDAQAQVSDDALCPHLKCIVGSFCKKFLTVDCIRLGRFARGLSRSTPAKQLSIYSTKATSR
jgi:hypothetical protein